MRINSASDRGEAYPKIVTFIFLGIVLFLLITEHKGHLYIALPWILVAGVALLIYLIKRRHNEKKYNGDKIDSGDVDGYFGGHDHA